MSITEYVKLTKNTSPEIVQPKKETKEYFTLTNHNIGTVLEVFFILFTIIGAVMFYRFKIINLEKGYKNLKKITTDHEERIKVNEEKQSHYATKEAVLANIEAKETGLDALTNLQNILHGDNKNG